MLFPAKFIDAESVVIESQTKTLVTEYGFNSEVAKIGNQHRWAIEFRTPPIDLINLRELSAFINSLDGRFTVFSLNNPLPYLGSSGTANATHLAGSNDITLTGASGLAVGEYFKFSNHDKVYQITAISGSVITIYPKLFNDIDNTTTLQDAVYQLRLTKDKNALSYSAINQLESITITAVENV